MIHGCAQGPQGMGLPSMRWRPRVQYRDLPGMVFFMRMSLSGHRKIQRETASVPGPRGSRQNFSIDPGKLPPGGSDDPHQNPRNATLAKTEFQPGACLRFTTGTERREWSPSAWPAAMRHRVYPVTQTAIRYPAGSVT